MQITNASQAWKKKKKKERNINHVIQKDLLSYHPFLIIFMEFPRVEWIWVSGGGRLGWEVSLFPSSDGDSDERPHSFPKGQPCLLGTCTLPAWRRAGSQPTWSDIAEAGSSLAFPLWVSICPLVWPGSSGLRVECDSVVLTHSRSLCYGFFKNNFVGRKHLYGKLCISKIVLHKLLYIK